jgi:hypothetical protein
MQRIAEDDWQIAAEYPGMETRYIKGLKSKADVDDWLAGSRRIDWLRSQGYAKWPANNEAWLGSRHWSPVSGDLQPALLVEGITRPLGLPATVIRVLSILISIADGKRWAASLKLCFPLGYRR